MAEGIAYSIVGKIGEYLVAPIGRQFGYLFCYNNNIQNLRDHVQHLENTEVGVQLLVDAAKRNIEVIGPDVEDWLKKVNEIKREAKAVFDDTTKVGKGCLNGWCLNLKSRYLLSRKATKKTQAVVELQGKGNKYTKLSYPAPPVGMTSTSTEGSKGFGSRTSTTKDIVEAPAPSVLMPSTSTEGSKGFESRMSITKNIIEVLRKDEISMIGICGMGGVGKTTMVKDVVARAKVENLFQEVAMAVVSQNQDLMKIQDHLASKLGLKFVEGTDIEARAERLHQRLTNGNKILVILDDVWDELDLKKVGIPVGGDRKGCKVVLTSRIGTVCSDMGTQDTFTVLVLPEQEAWDLFKQNAGNSVDAVDLHPIAKEVVRECGGLPIAIVTVGKALKNRDKHAWEDALRQLSKSALTNIRGMHKNVYSSIKLSYNCVESIQARSLLLLCCLFPEDFHIPVDQLVRYGVGLELFKDEEKLADTRDRVYSLVDELKCCSLLLDGNEDSVKVHDVIRDVCLSIASEQGYAVKHDIELKKWPKKSTAISLMFSQMHGLPDGLDFPRHKLLQLIGSFKSPENLRDFFPGMRELRVAAFSGFSVETPPLSLQFLTNIRTLCLHSCYIRNTNISVIGSLKDLEILSFFSSELEELPREFGQLSNLKLLDLRCKEGPRILPPGVLSNLCGLEELYIAYRYWAEEGYERNASIIELNSLSHLNALELCISDVELLPKDICMDKLKRFNITIGKYQLHSMSELTQFQNRLAFDGHMNIHLETGINALLRITEDLSLEVKGLRNLVKDLDEEGFVNLKKLDMSHCGEVECLIDAMDLVTSSAFGRLEEVRLFLLPAMRHLWRGPIQPPCLSNLRVLRMQFCHSIESLFPRCAVKCLVQLQSLNIQLCEMLKEFFSSEGGEDNEKDTEKFPKLRELTLHSLPRLRRLDFLLFSRQVAFSSLEELSISDNVNLDVIRHGQLPNSSLCKLREIYLDQECDEVLLNVLPRSRNLEILSIHCCSSLEELFEFEDGHKEITPEFQPKGVRVQDGILVFKNLRRLSVCNCCNLRNLLPCSMARCLLQLQTLEIRSCELMEEIVTKQGGEERMDTIVFPQLTDLTIVDLQNLTSFCFGNYDFEFPALADAFIRHCPKMKTFSFGLVSSPKLEKIRVGYRYEESIWMMNDLNSTIQDIFDERKAAEEEEEEAAAAVSN